MRKRLNKTLGNLGEEAAERFLRAKGYRILARNFRGYSGEIDIIAEDRGTLAFVEVKTRSPRAHLSPASAVDERKRHQIRKTAKQYVSAYKQPSPTRFDVVSVMVNEEDVVAELHLETDAFK